MRTLITSILVFSFSFAFSQNLNQLMEDNSYDQIKEIYNSKYKGKSFLKSSSNYATGYKQYKRWENFWRQNLMPNGDFPAPGIIYDAWKEQTSNNSLKSTAESNWEYVGPKNLPTASVDAYPGMGRVNAIGIHPTNHNIIFAGGAGSGIWKSTDMGKTWASKTDNLPNIGISDIAFDPTNPNIVYAATGDADGGKDVYATGIFKSTDLGETWSIVGMKGNLSDSLIIRRFVIPAANTILATTDKGIQKSTDGGVNWTIVSDTSCYSIVNQPESSTVLYAGTTSGKVLRSKDGGNTWVNVIPDNLVMEGRVEVGVTKADPNQIVVLSAGFTVGSLKSTNGGESWVSISPPDIESQNGFNLALAVSPVNKDLMLFGGVHGWRSTDGGSTFEKYLNGYWETGYSYFYVHSDHHVFRFVPGTDTLFTGNDGGVFYGDASSSNKFIDISKGLYVTQYYGIGLYKQRDDVIIGGSQDNDGIFINGTSEKGILPISDAFDGLIDYSDPNISYVSRVEGESNYKTTDGWVTSNELSIPDFSSSWDVPMVMHPTDPSTIFFAGVSLVKSTDKGENWTTLYTYGDGGDVILQLAISPSNPNVIAFSTEVELKRTIDGGTNWTDLGLPIDYPSSISGIAFHPTHPDTMYATASGFNAGNKVFKSTDGGKNWTNISTNLPNIPVYDIKYAAGTNDDLYIGTALGVYYNSGGQSNWSLFSTNLPYTNVYELEMHYATNSVFAATYGRGLWKSPVASVSTNSPDINSEEEGISILPTLNNGIFNVEFKNYQSNQKSEILIFNTIGGVVFNSQVQSKTTRVNISNFSSGTYIVTVKTGNKIYRQKTVVSGR